MNQKQYTGWVNLQTIQSKEILSELIDAKDHQIAKLLISDTGLGKTNTIQMFQQGKPQHTYVITVGDSFKLIHVVDEIVKALGIANWDDRTTIYEKIRLIQRKLDTFKQDKKCKPIIILDEAENLKPQVLKMIKELYDAIHTYCSIVLIGTEQILDSILNRKNKNRQSVPQLWRRFKAGTRCITPLNKARDFAPFYNQYIPEQRDMQDMLNELCENYGELHDYLEPFLRWSSDNSKPVNEQNFRLFHKIPKTGIPTPLRKVS
jgi:DNA transposition AAA+ family ATPase